MQAPIVGGVRLPHGNGEVIRLARGASLSDFAEKINANPASLVQALFNLGEMVTATQSVGDETLELLGSEMNYVVQVVSPEDEDRELLESFDLSYGEDSGDEGDLEVRPPDVTVMGHVDHGKTRLLDTIRNASVREGEAGGITQHIGAYQVEVEHDGAERPITFIDTPGHEAFTAMRARGAKATDIAILVVAADDGVMPQTVEAINHAQAADVPIVVAVNKIDKEGADPAKIRAQLTEYNLVAEDYGGDTMFVDISAKQGTNIDQLLEAVVLTADAALDLRANPDMEAQGVAIEAHLDRGRGPVATVLIQRGTLRVGDSIVAGDAYGRVRRMVDEHGDDVHEALPSRPVQVIGFTSVPGAGDNLLVVDEDRIARQIADRRSARKRNALAARSRKRISLEDLDSALKETSQLNLILKGDNAGTVEALEEALDLEPQSPALVFDGTSTPTTHAVRFRVEDPGTGGNDTRFLHGLQGADPGQKQDRVTPLAGGSSVLFEGATVALADRTLSVLFLRDLAQLGGDRRRVHEEDRIADADAGAGGKTVEVDGEKFKEYYGSASDFNKGEYKHVEGKRILEPIKGKLANTLVEMEQDVQSSISYAGGKKLMDIRKVNYVILGGDNAGEHLLM